MKIVFMGTPEFSVNVLDKLNSKYEIELIVSQPNRIKKKNELLPTPVAKYAIDNNLELFQPENIKDDYEKILNTEAEILITAAYGQYIPSKILNKFKYKLNVHASLLPKHRGGAPIQRSIMEGDEFTGVSIMEMTKKLDAGKVYAVSKYKILDDDNSTSVFEKLSIIGSNLLMDNLEDIINDKNKGIEQDESLATYSKNIAREEEQLDLNKSTIEIINHIRGLANEPGAYINVNGVKFKIFKATKLVDNSNNKPGTVLSVKKGIIIKTIDGAISLDLVLLPGKKIMTGKDFSNGQKLFSEGQYITNENIN